MNSKQRRRDKRRTLEFVAILGEIADSIETGKYTQQEIAHNIRELQDLIKKEQPK